MNERRAATGSRAAGGGAVRSGLLAAAALAVGVWLGISVGLATRARHRPA